MSVAETKTKNEETPLGIPFYNLQTKTVNKDTLCKVVICHHMQNSNQSSRPDT